MISIVWSHLERYHNGSKEIAKIDFPFWHDYDFSWKSIVYGEVCRSMTANEVKKKTYDKEHSISSLDTRVNRLTTHNNNKNVLVCYNNLRYRIIGLGFYLVIRDSLLIRIYFNPRIHESIIISLNMNFL